MNTTETRRRARTSRDKGQRAEREIVEALRDRGFRAERSEQRYAGGLGNPDVITDAMLNGRAIHLEVKHEEAGSIESFMRQAISDCDGSMPVVIHRRNFGERLVTMRWDDFIDILRHDNDITP